jgi:hypothetical protein
MSLGPATGLLASAALVVGWEEFKGIVSRDSVSTETIGVEFRTAECSKCSISFGGFFPHSNICFREKTEKNDRDWSRKKLFRAVKNDWEL